MDRLFIYLIIDREYLFLSPSKNISHHGTRGIRRLSRRAWSSGALGVCCSARNCSTNLNLVISVPIFFQWVILYQRFFFFSIIQFLLLSIITKNIMQVHTLHLLYIFWFSNFDYCYLFYYFFHYYFTTRRYLRYSAMVPGLTCWRFT